MRKTKCLALCTLSLNPETRDDDVLLAFSVWESEGLVLDECQKQVLGQLSKPGSITRVRAIIQNEEQRFRPNLRKEGV
jgi:hypothetical protein